MNKINLRRLIYKINIFCILILCLFATKCIKRDKKDTQQEEVTLDFNYDSLVHRSKMFVPETGKSGGVLSLPIYNDPVSFNPITTPEAAFHMYEGLVKIDGVTGAPEPNLAERWDVSEDGLTWTFKIRKGVQWSDTVAFSAYDVEFTFNGLIYNRI